MRKCVFEAPHRGNISCIRYPIITRDSNQLVLTYVRPAFPRYDKLRSYQSTFAVSDPGFLLQERPWHRPVPTELFHLGESQFIFMKSR